MTISLDWQPAMRRRCEVPSENDPKRGDHDDAGNTRPAPASSNAQLASRFQQMFPVLSPAEIDRIRPFGEVLHFRDGEVIFEAGKPGRGMYIILSGRVAITGRDPVGQAIPTGAFAELMGATPEDMAELVPGSVRTAGRTVSYTGDDYREVFRAWRAMYNLASVE